MRALNTIGRPIIDGDATISASASHATTYLDDSFVLPIGIPGNIGTPGVTGSAFSGPVDAIALKTVQLSDGTLISFSNVRLPVLLDAS